MRFITAILVLCSSLAALAQEISIIPQPLSLKEMPGRFTVKDRITVSSNLPDHEWPRLFNYLQTEMKKQFGVTVTEAAKGETGTIFFGMQRMPTSGKPAYTLKVTPASIVIISNFSEPAFHAIQTLFQLMPVEGGVKREIPCVEIFDHARFHYRGMHLDCSRHFWPVDFIKRYIDYLAYHKINTFHWHLTDDQGWRIEIKKYPRLSSVGSWRNGTITGRYPGTGNDAIRYGGYYTREEIREIVKYAGDRFINVIPEIEMPGHSSAAIAAYPDLSCFPQEPTIRYFPKSSTWSGDSTGKQVQQTWGVFDDVFCAGKENSFRFIEDVLDEVLELFPSKYIHVGGDECPKANWKRCSACQQRIKDLQLKDEHELQSYFIQRVEKYLNGKNRTLIGWDEILEGGLAPNAVVMSWRGEKGGIEAAKQKHYVVMSPGNPVYFDHSQSDNEDSVTIGGYNPIEKVYAWNPVPAELSTEEGKYIMGAQANVWTEYMKHSSKVEYMIFPRMAALSEVLWSTPENKNWPAFEKKLMTQLTRYERWGARYSKAYFDLKATVIPGEKNGVAWKLESRQQNSIIRYISHFAGRPYPMQFSEGTAYSEPVAVRSDQLLAAINMAGDKPQGNPVYQTFHFNKATGKKISLEQAPSKNYPGDGPFTLVNGVINEKGMARSREFLGFSGEDCVATIDLDSLQEINELKVHYLSQPGSWIWEPARTEAMASADGQQWYFLAETSSFQEKPGGKGTMSLMFKKIKARFIKLTVYNRGTIPPANPGAGNKAWLFVDEIEVQ